MQLKVKKLTPDAILPTRGSSQAAGWDLYSNEGYVLEGGETHLFHTGIAIEIPSGYFGAIYARSGLAIKEGLRPANCVGIIDSDYRGEICVGLHSDAQEIEISRGYNIFTEESYYTAHSDSLKQIEKGQRIAQLVIQKYENIELVEVDELDETERGEGGFGSTGKR